MADIDPNENIIKSKNVIKSNLFKAVTLALNEEGETLASFESHSHANSPSTHSPFFKLVLHRPTKRSKETLENLIYRFKKFGNILTVENEVTVEVSGRKNVIGALELFMDTLEKQDTPAYDAQQNATLLKKIETLKNKLIEQQKHQLAKIQEEAALHPIFHPVKSKKSSLYKDTQENAAKNDMLQPTHFTTIATRETVTGVNTYVLKHEHTDAESTELEAFNSRCLRLLLGKRVKKVSSNYDPEDHQLTGSSATFIPEFNPLQRHFAENQFTTPPIEPLIKAEIGKIWAAAYCEEENDLHGGNYGFGFKEKVMVYMDMGQATFPISATYAGFDPQVKDEKLPAAPIDAFPVTERDILNFPKLTDAKPNHWPDRSDRAKDDKHQERAIFKVEDYIHRPEIIDQKYYIFLKRILFDKSEYESLAKLTISNEEMRENVAAHKNNKTAELKNVLSKIPEFTQFIVKNPGASKQIIEELNEYNKMDFASIKYSSHRVDIKKIKKKFDDILDYSSMHQSAFNLYQKTKSMFNDYKNSRKSNSFMSYFRNKKLTQEKIELCDGVMKKLDALWEKTNKKLSLKSGEDATEGDILTDEMNKKNNELILKNFYKELNEYMQAAQQENIEIEKKYNKNYRFTPTKSGFNVAIENAKSLISAHQEGDDEEGDRETEHPHL